MLEASRIVREGHQTTLGKAQRIKETEGAGDTRLLFKHKRWFWGIKAEATLIILGENTCPCNLLRAASSCTKCNDACSRSSGRHTAHGRVSLALGRTVSAHWNMALTDRVWS
eukprot:s1277_g15.t1